MPVLPLVASTRTLSGVRSPRRSPSRTMYSAARSLTLPPGLYHSALAYTLTGATDCVMRLKSSNGVFPISSRTERPAATGRIWGEVTAFKDYPRMIVGECTNAFKVADPGEKAEGVSGFSSGSQVAGVERSGGRGVGGAVDHGGAGGEDAHREL